MAMRVLVSGRVQGVGFRAFTQDVAREMSVAGWVRNLPDGRVEAHLQGAGGAVGRVVDRLRDGPRAGRVDDLRTSEVSDEPMQGFDIRI